MGGGRGVEREKEREEGWERGQTDGGNFVKVVDSYAFLHDLLTAVQMRTESMSNDKYIR